MAGRDQVSPHMLWHTAASYAMALGQEGDGEDDSGRPHGRSNPEPPDDHAGGTATLASITLSRAFGVGEAALGLGAAAVAVGAAEI